MRSSARAILGGLPLALAGAYVVWPHALGDGAVFDLYNVVEVTCAVSVALAVICWRPRPPWPWALVAVSIALWVAGDVVYGALGTNPTVSVADAFYVAGYATLATAVVRLVHSDHDQRTVDGFIDLGIVSVAALYAAWVLLVAPTWERVDVSGIGRCVVSAYPALDAALLILLAQLLVSPRRTPAVLTFSLGMAIVFAGDLAYSIVERTSYAGSTRLLDASWPVGYACVALAMAHPSVRVWRSRVPADPVPRPRGLHAAAVALLAMPAVALGGKLVNHDLQPVPLFVASGVVVGLVFVRVIRIDRDARRATAALERSKRYFQALAMNSSDAFAVINADHVVSDASLALERVIGWPRDYVIGHPIDEHLAELVHPDDRAVATAFMHRVRALRDRGPLMVEFRLRRPDDSFAWLEVHASNLLDDRDVRGVVLNVHAIDERKRAEAERLHESLHDPLTQLPNRALLRDRIGQALARHARTGNPVAVLFCDLDGFKTVNETMGHDAGDELLIVAAARLAAVARAEDTLARVGGDEFAVVVELDGSRCETAVLVADRMRKALSDPVEIDNTPMVMTASIGVALSAGLVLEADHPTDEMLREADIAMYEAKAAGGNRSVVYDPAMNPSAVNQFSLARELLEAIAQRQFVLHYQPVVEIDTQVLVGFEALIRWEHPTRGLVAPSEFIPIAEKRGIIVDIGRWILRTACDAAARWPTSPGRPPLTVAVNLAAAQLESDTLMRDVTTALGASGLDPHRLVLEITESTLIAHSDAVRGRLAELRRLGVRVAIDDFGTGYSSLAYLQRFPIDVLKIDRSFIQAIDDPERLPGVVRGLIELGRRLEFEIIAEGVETAAQAAALAQEGGLLGQGYLFSRPLAAPAAAQFAARATAAPATSEGR